MIRRRWKPREALKVMLQDAHDECEGIMKLGFVDQQKTALAVWQPQVTTLLKDAIFKPESCWRGFENLGPKSGEKIPTQMWEQERYLADILQNFDAYELKETWRPPGKEKKKRRLLSLFRHNSKSLAVRK